MSNQTCIPAQPGQYLVTVYKDGFISANPVHYYLRELDEDSGKFNDFIATDLEQKFWVGNIGDLCGDEVTVLMDSKDRVFWDGSVLTGVDEIQSVLTKYLTKKGASNE